MLGGLALGTGLLATMGLGLLTLRLAVASLMSRLSFKLRLLGVSSFAFICGFELLFVHLNRGVLF